MSTKRGARPLFVVSVVLLGMAAARSARRWLDVVEVEGGSMAPALLPGDLLVAERLTFRRRAPRPGEVVLARDPRDASRELVKRVAALSDGRIALRGDDPSASTDSRAFGTLPVGEIAFRVAWRYWPPRRFGPVRAQP